MNELDLLDQGRHDQQQQADGEDEAGQEDDGDRPSALDPVPDEPLDHRVEAQGGERREADVDEDRRDVGERDAEQQGDEPAEGQQHPDGERIVDACPERSTRLCSAVVTDAPDSATTATSATGAESSGTGVFALSSVMPSG